MYLGSYGHMGMFDQEMIVDRMISMKEQAWPERSKAELEQQWRLCMAIGSCVSPRKLEAMHKNKK